MHGADCTRLQIKRALEQYLLLLRVRHVHSFVHKRQLQNYVKCQLKTDSSNRPVHSCSRTGTITGTVQNVSGSSVIYYQSWPCATRYNCIDNNPFRRKICYNSCSQSWHINKDALELRPLITSHPLGVETRPFSWCCSEDFSPTDSWRDSKWKNNYGMLYYDNQCLFGKDDHSESFEILHGNRLYKGASLSGLSTCLENQSDLFGKDVHSCKCNGSSKWSESPLHRIRTLRHSPRCFIGTKQESAIQFKQFNSQTWPTFCCNLLVTPSSLNSPVRKFHTLCHLGRIPKTSAHYSVSSSDFYQSLACNTIIGKSFGCVLQLLFRGFTKTATVPEEGVISGDEIEKFLAQQGMKYEQGFTSFITRCPKLGQNNKNSKKMPANTSEADQLFVNMTTGHFLCRHCDKRGGWHDLQDNIMLLSAQKRKKDFQCFKNVDSVHLAGSESHPVKDLWNGAIALSSCSNDVITQVLEDFNISLLAASTLDLYDVKYDTQSHSLLLPAFDGERRLMGIKRLACAIPEADDCSRVIKESILPRSGILGMFGFARLERDASEVVLTATEIDVMAVYQATRSRALALPNGFSSLPQEMLPALEKLKKIVLWLGDDVRAWEAAKLFAKKLNNDRCFIIRPSVNDPSPMVALQQGLNLKTILDKAKPINHKSIVTFSQLRQEIFSELSHVEQVAGIKWKRYTALNRLLKGHRRGELTVFTGPTGSGKTTFMSDYSLDLCMQGVNTLWGSFEINNIRLGKMMLTQFAQINLSKHLDKFDNWANTFESLPMYFLTFHGQESIHKVIEAMSHAVYVHDIAHVVVDNLQFMMGSNGDWSDRFVKQDSIISAFRKFATNMNCHVTVVVHPRKEKESEDLTTASVFGSAKATQEADNVMILQDKRLMSVRGRKYLQITKNRFDGELGVMLLKFDKDTLSFVVRDKPAKRGDMHKEDGHSEEGFLPALLDEEANVLDSP